MKSYAYYRLPYTDRYTEIESDASPLILHSLEEVGKEAGFCIAPFEIGGSHEGAGHPILLIRPDRISVLDIPALNEATDKEQPEADICDTADADYAQVFGLFHKAIQDGRFRKLVLARHKTMACSFSSSRELHKQLFWRICHSFPRLMIMLFSTPESGTWIIASPEILTEASADTFHTVALAGTMPYREGYAEWSEKNKAEQHIVELYIEKTIEPIAKEIVKDGPYTMRAGHLVHLRTDFRFKVAGDNALGRIISRLHPTPAVCGLPKEEARLFILRNEGQDRRYYSGFAGPVGIGGETHLYVSLRCAELSENGITAYAGGGIMPESDCSSEWMETEMKMRTIISQPNNASEN